MARIAEGVHRLGTSLVNWYLVEDGGRLTVVDAGLPRYRGQLDAAVLGFGHGDPWTDGAAAAVARARELGPS